MEEGEKPEPSVNPALRSPSYYVMSPWKGPRGGAGMSLKGVGGVAPALPHHCCVAVDKSLPFPEPQSPHFKAKAASHLLLLLLFFAAGAVTSSEQRWACTGDGRQTPGDAGSSHRSSPSLVLSLHSRSVLPGASNRRSVDRAEREPAPRTRPHLTARRELSQQRRPREAEPLSPWGSSKGSPWLREGELAWWLPAGNPHHCYFLAFDLGADPLILEPQCCQRRVK